MAGLLAGSLALEAATPPRLEGAGLDAVLVVDVSRSMAARDAAPSRLRRALRLAEGLVRQAEHARLALVLFAGDAFTALPLTLDRDAHLAYLAAVDTDVISQRGSDLARALRAAGETFDPRSGRPRALVLLSDGEHAGESLGGPLTELERAGVRVTAVGLGGSEGAVVPGVAGRPLLDADGHTVVSRRDDEVLARIAGRDGRYYRESEDAPAPADLLPAPEARPAARPGPRLALLLGALAALAGELWLSTRAGSRSAAVPLLAGRRAALAAAAAALLALGPPSRLERGDAALEQGDAQEALSLYRRAERARGSNPPTRIRVGNALYRLGEHQRAAGAYLEALRGSVTDDPGARFAAAFNLGNTLLELERFEEARESFWSALLERPSSLEAKFNYEWASARTPRGTPPAAAPRPSPQAGTGGADAAPKPAPAAGSRAARERRAQPRLTPEEAERWLDAIDDALAGPLRSQAARGGSHRSRGGPTW